MAPTFRCSRILAHAVPLLLAITLCAGQEAQPSGGPAGSQAARALGKKRPVRGVDNFGEVTPTLFRGAQPSHEGFEKLAKMGVGIVVDTRGNRTASEGKEVGKLGMQYVDIPWHCPFPNDAVFIRFLTLLQENPDKKIFVHCRLGEDRTGMMVAAYRIAAQGWTADEAMQEMKQFGFAGIHHLICPGLASYEKAFPQHLVSNPAFKDLRIAPASGTK